VQPIYGIPESLKVQIHLATFPSPRLFTASLMGKETGVAYPNGFVGCLPRDRKDLQIFRDVSPPLHAEFGERLFPFSFLRFSASPLHLSKSSLSSGFRVRYDE
jgi:hypothetical protein